MSSPPAASLLRRVRTAANQRPAVIVIIPVAEIMMMVHMIHAVMIAGGHRPVIIAVMIGIKATMMIMNHSVIVAVVVGIKAVMMIHALQVGRIMIGIA